MNEILPGVFHWTALHPDINLDVHCYYLSATEPAVLIDPLLPAEGVGWFETHDRPEHIILTNRLHYRHCEQFFEVFSPKIWCHQAGMHEFTQGEPVTSFEHGDELPGGVLAVEVGSLCPEETALYIPQEGGILSIGDAVVRWDGELMFVPDRLMGEDPEGVKSGLLEALERLLEQDFEHLLFAHGEPIIGGAKAALKAFVEQAKS